ncbi:unnamed protein product [Nippostrongylus brasiliensis]|uniref:GYF_2 domain-containing protein n=1 Tax=Nippostrongylus brasiliensis TaxID=27835 RepID=A0A0N4XVJ1_NIPBR|nr:unnamed protein product [Nippostrongylus brasiliensis]
MAPMTTLPDFGLNTDDIKYFKMDSIIRGKGPDRLKYLDLEGRWILSGKSMPYISAAFNHLERLNDARVPFRDISREPINALGMVGWTPSSIPVETPVQEKVPERKPVAKFKLPVSVLVDDDVPPSPRENVPHRTAGYGLAHQKRKLTVPDRSRSVSPMRAESPAPTYDKYAKYERNRTGDVASDSDSSQTSYEDLEKSPPFGWCGLIWYLVEEKCSLIRVEETEYYFD